MALIPPVSTAKEFMTAAAVQYVLLDVWADAKGTDMADEISDLIQLTRTRTLFRTTEIADVLDRLCTAVIDSQTHDIAA